MCTSNSACVLLLRRRERWRDQLSNYQGRLHCPHPSDARHPYILETVDSPLYRHAGKAPVCLMARIDAIYKSVNVHSMTGVGQLGTALLRTFLAKGFRAPMPCHICIYAFLSVLYLLNEFVFYRCLLAVCHLSQCLNQELPNLLWTSHRAMHVFLFKPSATTPDSTTQLFIKTSAFHRDLE
jgi:hypothetical protein